jgi:hypothetical protein
MGGPGKAPIALQIEKFHCEGLGVMMLLSAKEIVKFPDPSQEIGTVV